MFNELYDEVIEDYYNAVYRDKGAVPLDIYHTIAWNAAFNAASIVSRDEKLFLKKLQEDVR